MDVWIGMEIVTSIFSIAYEMDGPHLPRDIVWHLTNHGGGLRRGARIGSLRNTLTPPQTFWRLLKHVVEVRGEEWGLELHRNEERWIRQLF